MISDGSYSNWGTTKKRLTTGESGWSDSKKFESCPVQSELNPYNGLQYSARYYDLLKQRKNLPAWNCRRTFLRAVKRNQCIVLVGETGSGKTTQCAQFLLSSGYHGDKCIACTQPRRVAAMSVAQRVADEMDVELGKQVGYRIRFEDVSSLGVTILKYLTDGSLLREAQSSPTLDRYSIVILDEAHERTLDTDILLGLLKETMKARSDLKVIVMSATLDSQRFQTYLDCPIVEIPGRVHPVEIFYTREPEPDYFEAAMRTCLKIHAFENPGDILLFLTGEEEIENMKLALEDGGKKMRYEHGELIILPLYSSLAPAQQQKIFTPAPGPSRPEGPQGRKIIISTNIAETSITIDGIVYVVDPGFSKQKVYNPRTRVETLLSAPISKASANQRAGRAGRTQPGKCYRLYTENTFNSELSAQSHPEILRSNLSSVVMTLLKLGVEDLVHFDFIEPPAPETLMRALEELNYLGALSDEGNMTPLGELMAEFPLDPQLSKMAVDSSKYQCTPEILVITAMLSVPNVFLRPHDQTKEADTARTLFTDSLSDHITLLNVYQEFKKYETSTAANWCWENYLHNRALSAADRIKEQLIKIYSKLKLEIVVSDNKNPKYSSNIRRGILAGYFMQVARLNQNNIYTTLRDNQPVLLHPSSNLNNCKPEWVLYHEYVMTTKSFIRTVSQFEPTWLKSIAPIYFNQFGKSLHTM